jgi:hypothetical protein
MNNLPPDEQFSVVKAEGNNTPLTLEGTALLP